MWVAYADVGLLLRIYLMCSLCLTVIDLPVQFISFTSLPHESWDEKRAADGDSEIGLMCPVSE